MLSPSFALAFRSLFIISYSVAFVKHFFDFFFRSLPLSGGDSLFILPHLSAFVNTFFRGSDIFSSLPAALAVELSPLGRFSHRCFSAFCRVLTGQLIYNTTLSSYCQHLFLKKFNFFCSSSFSVFYRLFPFFLTLLTKSPVHYKANTLVLLSPLHLIRLSSLPHPQFPAVPFPVSFSLIHQNTF